MAWNPGVGRDKRGYQKSHPSHGGGGGGGDGPKPHSGPTAAEIAAAKAKAEAEKRRLETEARQKHLKDFKDTQKKKVRYKNLKTGPYFGATIDYEKSLNPRKTWKDHAILTDLVKKNKVPGGDIPNYHQITAHDFDEKFNLPDPISKGLATGYQYLTEGYKSLTGGKDFSKAMATAAQEATLNKLGIDGLNQTDMDNYNRALDYANINSLDDMRAFNAKYLAAGGVARKKYSTGTNGILDIEDEESEDISLTAFNPKFDDVPELTEEKEEEKIDLFSETEEGDPLNELLLAEDGVTTLFKAKNGGYAVQGGVKNYLGEQKMVHAPKYWQSAPDHPETELTYITKPEKDLLVKADLHGSLHGSVNRGPQGLASLNGWGDANDGFSDKSYGGSETYGGSNPGGDDQEDDVAQMMQDMNLHQDHSPNYTGSDAGWVVSEDEETEIGGSDYIGPGDKVRIHNEILNRKNTWDKNKWKRDATTMGGFLLFPPTTIFGALGFAKRQEAKKKARIAEIDEELELLDKIGATKFTPHTDTLYQRLEQEKLDLTQPRSRDKDDGQDGGPKPPVVAPVTEEIEDSYAMVGDWMSRIRGDRWKVAYLDKLERQAAELQENRDFQENTMFLNSGGLANLFRVKN